jgi:ABC-type bacteriocin/lantibiotic exporter with double-glycine peptidase domain
VIFETLKAIFVVGYLFSKLGWITFVGLMIGGVIVQFIGVISKKIEDANFRKLRATESKTKILTEYFSRIIDYQMSWLDGYIGNRI